MTSEQDKDVVRRLFAAFDAVDTAAMDELLSPEFVAHGLAPLFTEDAAGWKQLAAHWSVGFSDEELTFNDFVAEAGKVAVRWTSQATHSAEVFGLPATNRRVTISGIDIYHLTGGRCSEYWGELNLTDLTAPR